MAASVLDDLKYIHAHDASGLLQYAEQAALQLAQKYAAPAFDGEFHSVVCTAMGGSALPARLLQTWPACTVPIEVCSSYGVPEYVSENTLVVAVSYSGNTEETVAAAEEASRRGATVVVIAGGGKLKELAQKQKFMYIELPATPQPRFATFYVYRALLAVCEAGGLLRDNKVVDEAEALAAKISKSVINWRPDVPLAANQAKQIAMEIAGTTPVVYSDALLSAAACKWKIAINENAKNVAWWGAMPEMCHNELTGWSSHPVEKIYSVVTLRSSYELPAIQKRFMVTEKLLSGRRPAALQVHAEGDSLPEQLFWLCSLGDHVSIYLGLLNGVDIAGLPLVDKLKAELSRTERLAA